MRLVVVTTLVGVLVAAVVVAQRAPGRATESPRPLGRLEGVVTGRRGPLSGAGVDLRGSREFVRNTRTDTAGRFSFSNVPAGLYEVEASSEGLVPVVMHVGVGNHEEALRWLERAFEHRAELGNLNRGGVYWLKPLRADPRYQEMLRRLRFPG